MAKKLKIGVVRQKIASIADDLQTLRYELDVADHNERRDDQTYYREIYTRMGGINQASEDAINMLHKRIKW